MTMIRREGPRSEIANRARSASQGWLAGSRDRADAHPPLAHFL